MDARKRRCWFHALGGSVALAIFAACAPADPDDGSDYEIVTPRGDEPAKRTGSDETNIGTPEPADDRTVEDVEGSAPKPAAECKHECTTVDRSQCSGPSSFRTCFTAADGCRKLTTAKSCTRSVPSPGCFAYPSACFGTCKDTCSNEGAITCTGSTTYQQCVRGSDQCLKWAIGSCKSTLVCFASPSACRG
jgi:hypothetical protein